MSSEKIYPTWATKTATTDAPATTKPTFPATKAQQYGVSTLYRPQRPPSSPPRRRKNLGRCCRSCLIYTAVILLALAVLAALAFAVFYALYHPHRPDFSLSSLKISTLNVSSPALFSSSLSLSVSARNPNSKVSFSYDTTAVSVSSATSDTRIATGRFLEFVQPAKKTTALAATLNGKGLDIGAADISALKTQIRKQSGLNLVIAMDTTVRIKIGKLITNKFRVRVSCDGIKANANSKGKFSASVKTSGVKCKEKLSLKIWRWNLSF